MNAFITEIRKVPSKSIEFAAYGILKSDFAHKHLFKTVPY
jgi:hypothetical protein